MTINLDRIFAAGCRRSLCRALGISLVIGFGQLAAGPAAAQFNPDALGLPPFGTDLPPSGVDLPPSGVEGRVPQKRYGQPAPGYRRSPYSRRDLHRGRR
ncbi:hypothetical protein [Methylocystis sp.]|uniref:hypothetical protein n=1 Tax=Methylocystis sp. TaxID=1911079 RepID=UPI003D11D681